MKTTRKTTPGIDNIDGRALKAVAVALAEPLCYFINESFEKGVFPDSLKHSKCVPIFKKGGSKFNKSDYRSVCIQSQIGKVLEAAFLERLTIFLEKNNLLSDTQHGFRKNRATHTALSVIVDFIHDALNGRNEAVALLFDLTRAFDTVDHNLLLKKVWGIGIRGVAHSWIRSYLENRTQSVNIGNCTSRSRSIKVGVPQGSLLGPILFIMFSNDLSLACGKYGTIVSYADDTSILVSSGIVKNLIDSCNVESNQFHNYCKVNGLHLNKKKTCYIRLLPKNATIDNSLLLRLDNLSIRSTECVKILGLIFDCKLKWHSHIDELLQKISKTCYLFRCLRNCVSSHVLRSVYFAMVQSRLTYGISFWGKSASAEKVFKLQKRLLRIMFYLHPRSSCKEIFVLHNILTVPSLYILDLVTNIKTKVCQFPRVGQIQSSHNLRNNEDLQMIFSRVEIIGKQNVNYLGVLCYNKVRKVIKDCDLMSISLFKKKVRSHLSSRAYYSIDEYLCSQF